MPSWFDVSPNLLNCCFYIFWCNIPVKIPKKYFQLNFSEVHKMVVRSYDDEMQYVERVNDHCWRIKKGFQPNMNVEVCCSHNLTVVSFNTLDFLSDIGQGCFLYYLCDVLHCNYSHFRVISCFPFFMSRGVGFRIYRANG